MRRPRMTKGLVQRLYEALHTSILYVEGTIRTQEELIKGDGGNRDFLRLQKAKLAQMEKDREWLSRAQAWLEWRSSKGAASSTLARGKRLTGQKPLTL